MILEESVAPGLSGASIAVPPSSAWFGFLAIVAACLLVVRYAHTLTTMNPRLVLGFVVFVAPPVPLFP